VSAPTQPTKRAPWKPLLIASAVLLLLCGAMLVVVAPKVLVAEPSGYGSPFMWIFGNHIHQQEFGIIAPDMELQGIRLGRYTLILGNIHFKSKHGEYEILYDASANTITYGEVTRPAHKSGFIFVDVNGEAEISFID